MDNLVRVRERMAQLDAPGILISDLTNIQWLTGFTGSSALAYVDHDHAFFITDSRYTVQATDQVKSLEVISFRSPDTQIVVLEREFKQRGIRKVAFETSVRYDVWSTWTQKLSGCEWVASPDVLPALRMIKTAEEISKIERACALADACFAHVCRMTQVGVTEYDLSLDIEFYMRRHGAALAFEVIAVSGPNSAKPHGRPTDRKLERGDFVTFDFGATLNGYNSDLTRTVVIGEPTDRHEEVYGAVLKAQVAAIEALKPGVNGKDVDSLVRSILDERDLSQYFGHGLGHGLGRAVHDYGSLSQVRDQLIEVGQVWTVEPGVYIEGWGGVRIEDDVVIEEDGARRLTHSPKELLVLS